MFKVLDLFSGVGGFSEVFSQAGFKITAALDNWQLALDSHKVNHPHTKHINKNIQDVKIRDLEKFNANIILGSPPCQQFSVANNNPDVEKGLELTNIRKQSFLFSCRPGFQSRSTIFKLLALPVASFCHTYGSISFSVVKNSSLATLLNKFIRTLLFPVFSVFAFSNSLLRTMPQLTTWSLFCHTSEINRFTFLEEVLCCD